MTLTQRITEVIQHRKIMQRQITEQQPQPVQQHHLSRQATSHGRVTVWRGGKRV